MILTYAGIVDSSGFRVYYTDQQQKNDAGLLIIGQNVGIIRVNMGMGARKIEVERLVQGTSSK